MFRNLILAIAVFLALFPGAIWALELGGIRAQSALNEPFSGEIELLEISPDQIGAVQVLLASEEEFNKIGAPRPEFLSGLSFTPEISPQGSTVIRVTSQEPVREPYLDFLVEVNSPAGRLVKEYTVLLDPPATVDSAPPQVDQPAIARPKPEPVAQQRATPTPSRESAQASASTDASAFPMRYGPVESGAALWRVARKMAAESEATVPQTAMALYRSNQQAFIRGDINRLKVGKILRIPTSAELYALDAKAANREFHAAMRGEDVTATPLTDVTAAPSPEDLLQIAGSADPISTAETLPGSPPAKTTGQESVGPGTAATPAGSQQGDAAAPDLSKITENLLLVQETGESNRQETEELRSRIRELETQLADIQRLLKLSNERFAQLQAAGMDLPEDSAPDGVGAELGEAAIAQAEAPGESESAQAAPAPAEAPPAEPRVQPEAASEPVSAPSFWSSLPAPMLALAATVPLLVLALGWMIYKRRKSLEETPTPEEFAARGPEVAAAGAMASEPSTQHAGESPDTLLQASTPYSELASSGDETQEADVISEADVYIAYGRYREAETLLEEEIKRSPNRLDVKHKLAEAYYGAGNLQGMEEVMAQMRQAGNDRTNAEQWLRLEGMLRDLKHTNGGSESPSVLGGDAAGDGIAQLPVRPPTDDFPPPLSVDGAPRPTSSPKDAPSAEELTEALPEAIRSEDRYARELELEVEDLDVISGALQNPDGEGAPEISGSASDLELQLEDLEDLRDVDLANFSAREQPLDPTPAEAVAPDSRHDPGDSLDIPQVGKDSLANDVPSSQWNMDSGVWDEVATKIDLARAYAEMDDPEAARVILEEVAQEGNEDQRAEAREMMDQLD